MQEDSALEAATSDVRTSLFCVVMQLFYIIV